MSQKPHLDLHLKFVHIIYIKSPQLTVCEQTIDISW